MSHASYLCMSLIRLLLQQFAQGDGQGAFHQKIAVGPGALSLSWW